MKLFDLTINSGFTGEDGRHFFYYIIDNTSNNKDNIPIVSKKYFSKKEAITDAMNLLLGLEESNAFFNSYTYSGVDK